ncbi:MAG: hypothetical protein [Microvirus sp.]|nr:MAG: hypothetical protein [Microvirus sp.]
MSVIHDESITRKFTQEDEEKERPMYIKNSMIRAQNKLNRLIKNVQFVSYNYRGEDYAIQKYIGTHRSNHVYAYITYVPDMPISIIIHHKID